jgi:hypothetical protein
MKQYVATFHTHLSALMSSRTLARHGVPARMAPVPRKLSSSCGTCVYYEAEEPLLPLMDRDLEAVYEQADASFERIRTNE